MHKSILVLEESRMVHELFESALPEDYSNWQINHESLPDRYLQKAKETKPDIIFLSNQDQKRNYATVRQLKASSASAQTPILLLTSAKDKLDEKLLQSIGVRGFVRKPFETATLQKQINVVLKEQEQSKRKKPFDRFKDLNVVDDDLLSLIGKQTKPHVSRDDLEGELDPTLQLIPSTEPDEELEETELLAMEDSEEQLQTEFIEDEDEISDSLGDEIAGENLEGIDADYDEIELEELESESDFADLDDESPVKEIVKPNGEPIRLIQVEQIESSKLLKPLLNEPEDKFDLGFMELHVVPFRTEKIKSHVVETITEDFDEERFVKAHSPAELEDDFSGQASNAESYKIGESDEIEIHHEEIIEDFYEGDDDADEQNMADEDLLELSIEGMEDQLSDKADESESEVVAFEELEDTEDTLEELNIQEVELSEEIEDDEEESSLVIEEEIDDSDAEITTVEQEEGIDVEIDFQNDPTADLSEAEASQQLFEGFEDDENEDSLTESELEKRRSDQLDIDLEEIAAAGSEEASATIQEMIGFRQVMKAKYDLPDDDLGITSESEDTEGESGEDEDLLAEVESNLKAEDDLLLEIPDEMDSAEDEDDIFKTSLAESDEEPVALDLSEDDETSDLEVDDVDLIGDEDTDKLEDIDLTSDFDEELGLESTDGDADEADDEALLTDSGTDEDMFEDPDDFSLEKEEEEEEDLLMPLDEEDTDEESEFFSEISTSKQRQDDLFEEIELLSDEDPGKETNEKMLQVEEDTDDDIDTLVIDEDSEDGEALEAPGDPFATSTDFSNTSDEIEAMTPESMENIDFMPIDEDSDESDFELSVEIDSEDDDLLESESLEDETGEGSIDDIDFLPVDEEEANAERSIGDELPEIGADEEFKVDGEVSDEEFEFETSDLELGEEDEELPEPEAELLNQESLINQDDSTNSDEIMIEVPKDTFEMNDFNLRDITNDEGSSLQAEATEETEDQQYNLMEGIETIKAKNGAKPETSALDEESYKNIELPTMDEDLPDLPPILGEDDDEETSLDPVEQSESKKSGIRLMQSKYDFDEFDSDQGVIGIVDKPGSHTDVVSVSESDREAIKRQVKNAAVSLTPEFRKKLSAMIEGVVSETVHNTLQERLPGLVEKLLHEELGD